MAKNKTALNEADEELVDAVLGAKTGSEEGKAQLQALQNGLVDQIHKLGPTLDTPAGQQQLNDYLQGKTQEILGIVKSSGMDAQSKAEVLDALAQRYEAVKDSSGSGSGSRIPLLLAAGAKQAAAQQVRRHQGPPIRAAGTRLWPVTPCSTGWPLIRSWAVWGRWQVRRWVRSQACPGRWAR